MVSHDYAFEHCWAMWADGRFKFALSLGVPVVLWGCAVCGKRICLLGMSGAIVAGAPTCVWALRLST